MGILDSLTGMGQRRRFRNYFQNIGRGTAYAQEGHLEEAARAFRKALKSKMPLPEAHLGLGVLLASQGRLDDAVVHLRAAVGIKPDLAIARFHLAQAYYDHGRLEEAAAEFREVLQLEPRDFKACNNLGVVYAEQGRLQEAVEVFERCRALGARDGELYEHLGMCYVDLGRPDEGFAAFLEAGDHYIGTGMWEEAIEPFKEAVALRANDARAHFKLGYVYWIRQRRLGIECLRRFIELAPPESQSEIERAEEMIRDLLVGR